MRVSDKKRLQTSKVYSNNSFLIFVLGQGVSSLGDTFHFIAATMLLVNITGSGLLAAFGVICAPITSLLFSSFAGILGDKYSTKYVLIVLDLLKAVVALMFIGSDNLLVIYPLLFTLSALGTMYGPPSRKLVVNLLHDNEIIAANSLLSGVPGIAYIIGPILAGLVINLNGIDIAFYINSLSFVFSALTILLAKPRRGSTILLTAGSGYRGTFFNNMRDGFTYYKNHAEIKELIASCTIISVGTACMNIAFYPFVFDILKISSEEWGILMSVFYGTNVIAMLITFVMNKKMNGTKLTVIYFLYLVISAVWFFYGIFGDFRYVVLLQGIEGTLLCICGILLGSYLQVITSKAFTARIMGINDILNNGGKLVGISAAYIIIWLLSPRFVFYASSAMLALFSLHRIYRKLFSGSIHMYNRNF